MQGRFREESAHMRPRTGHHWEKILSIDDHVLDIAVELNRAMDKVFAAPTEFARLQRGFDHWDLAMMEHRLDFRLHALVRALEALFCSGSREHTAPICRSLQSGGEGRARRSVIQRNLRTRSQVEHSNDWRLAFRATRGSIDEGKADLLATFRVLQID